MPQGDSKVRSIDQTLRQRWVSAVLGILIALSFFLHLGQATPASADLHAAPAVMSSHGDLSCSPGKIANNTHCGTITACALYAPLEAFPEIFTADRAQGWKGPKRDHFPAVGL